MGKRKAGKLLFIFLLLICSQSTNAQFTYGTTGLLHMPTAEMQRDKTFMFGTGMLNSHILPSHEWWGDYNTYNYYLNITIFPWLEIGYTCVLVKGKPGIYHWPESTWGRFTNQDRSFHGRLRLVKEGTFFRHMPSIVVGANDLATGSWEGGSASDDAKYNGFFCRYYLAMTEHVEWEKIGSLGLHLAYVYNRKEDYHLNGPCLGANFQFSFPGGSFWHTALNGLNVMAEYDSRTFNIGMSYSVWKEHINLIGELNKCKYPSIGLCFKVRLK